MPDYDDDLDPILEMLEVETGAAELVAPKAAAFWLDGSSDDAMMYVAEAVARVQDLIRRLRKVELDLTAELGRHVRDTKAERLGYLPDGRQWKLHRTRERKAWDHDSWKHDARAKVAREVAPHADDVAVDAASGEARPLRLALQEAMTKLQEFHGAGAPRTGTLKANGLDPDDYCESVPGNWKLDTIEPNHDQED